MRIVKATVVVALLSFSSLCLVAAFALRVPVQAGGGATATQNGDVNGDGGIDVSDAIYTLLYLFKDGDPPVALADSPELVERVAALEGGFEALLTSIDQKLERIAVASEAALEAPCEDRLDRFVDNGDGTVTDICSGLMWQQITADPDGDPSTQDDVPYDVAVGAVGNLELAGHADWRMPTVEELSGLVLLGGIESSPPTSPEFGISTGRHWTSTPSVTVEDHGWIVDFSSRSREIIFRSNSAFVVAVRDLTP